MAGIPARLADGQIWDLPGAARAGGPDPAVEGLVAALWEAEDEVERGRAELALAIALLDRNYALGPAEYRELLEAEPGCPAASDLRRTLRAVADEYSRAVSTAPGTIPAPASLGQRLWARLVPHAV